jgi:hypothetical protein
MQCFVPFSAVGNVIYVAVVAKMPRKQALREAPGAVSALPK